MRKLWLGIVATMLMVVFVAPASAWEYSMTGEFQWRQQYISRMGNNDIFGDASVQDAGMLNPAVSGRFIGFAGPNIYTYAISNVGAAPIGNPTDQAGPPPGLAAVRMAINRGGFSQWGDAAWIGDQRLTFNPSIRVNNAVRISGLYTVGGYRNKFLQNDVPGAPLSAGIPPFERYGALSESSSAFNTVAVGSWEQVRATIQVPWGTIAIGHRDFPFGTGLSFAQNTPTSSTLLVVPYGPFRFLFATMLSEQATLGWDTVPDVDRKLNWRIGPGFTYENGPLSFGTIWLPQFRSTRRQLAVAGFGGVGAFGLSAAGASADTFAMPWNVFLKYNNGRFFANLEYFSANASTTFNYSPAVTGFVLNAGLSGPRYTESYKWMAEIGALCGPAKITGFAAYSSGQVLPGINVNQAAGFNTTKQYAIADANYQILQPYSFLMFPTYGGGNNRFNNDGTGQMGDAFALAARIDYAAAANLNLWGSYIHARRAEKHGYWAGSFNGLGVLTLMQYTLLEARIQLLCRTCYSLGHSQTPRRMLWLSKANTELGMWTRLWLTTSSVGKLRPVWIGNCSKTSACRWLTPTGSLAPGLTRRIRPLQGTPLSVASALTVWLAVEYWSDVTRSRQSELA